MFAFFVIATFLFFIFAVACAVVAFFMCIDEGYGWCATFTVLALVFMFMCVWGGTLAARMP